MYMHAPTGHIKKYSVPRDATLQYMHLNFRCQQTVISVQKGTEERQVGQCCTTVLEQQQSARRTICQVVVYNCFYKHGIQEQ
jgi:hypothetical protein